MNKQQYVYVMSNSSFPEDMLKIGWTREHPNKRANDLHTSGIPTPFIVEFVIITPEGSKLEKQIHNRIQSYRVISNREFFKISKEKLSEILIQELTLELTPVTEIMTPINTKISYGKKVSEIKSLCEQLEKETEEFFGKFKKEKSELVVTKIKDKKYVSIRAVEYDETPLRSHGFEDYDERRFKRVYHFINEDIIQYKNWLDDIISNYEEIKNRIGVEKIRSDTKSFKEMILDTIKKLHSIRNEYEWLIVS